MDPEDGDRDEKIGRISKLIGGMHVCAQKVKIRVNGEIIGGAAKSCAGYFKYPFFKLI